MIKFDVFNRWSGSVQFTAEIDCDENERASIKLGLAVKWAFKTGASLDGARLDGASLDGASLVGARLDGASLVGASLVGARLDGASLVGARLDARTLRSFKADYWMILAGARAEVPGLIKALREGRVDGSTYHGTCACLVGTIANVRHVSPDDLEMDSSRPAEQWFFMIKRGDRPSDKSGGGFAAAKALEWAEEFCLLMGIPLEGDTAPMRVTPAGADDFDLPEGSIKPVTP